MMIGTFSAASVIWVAAITAVAVNDKTHSNASSQAFVAMVFLFNAVFAFGITPLQALFPVEVLSFEMRAKGMAFSNLALTTAMLINQFAYPIALEKIEWRLYIVFAVWCPVQAFVVWLFIPETKNRTLEVSATSIKSLAWIMANIILRNWMTSSMRPIHATPRLSRRRSQLTHTATFWKSRRSKQLGSTLQGVGDLLLLFVHELAEARSNSE
jgi:hypothetical protein